MYLWLSSPWLHVFLLLSSPALLLLGNSDWLFDPVGYLDPWMYVGFFLHYDYPTILADEKKIARLPWILRGFAAYKLFGPIIASYVLHWCDLVAPAIALYFTLNRLFTRWIGFLVAGLILFFTPLFGPAGWDYHDSGDGFFYLASFLALSIAASRRENNGRLLFLAAVLYTITIHINIIFVNLAPLLILQYFCIRGTFDRRDLARLATTAIAAFCIVTVVLGLINLSVGRQFWFSSILFNRVTFFVEHPSRQVWWLPWSSGWLLQSFGTPLCLIAACSVAALAVLTRHGLRAALFGNPALSLQLQLLVAVVIFVAWQADGQTALQPWYMGAPLAYPAFLSLGGLFYLRCRQANASATLYASAALLLLFGAALLIGANFIGTLKPLRAIFGEDHKSIPLFAFYIVALLPLLFGRTWLAVASAYLLMIGSFLSLYGSQSGASFYSVSYGQGCGMRQRLFVTVETASLALRKHSVDPQNLRLWWNDDHTLNKSDPRWGCNLPMQFIAEPMFRTGFLPLAGFSPRLPKLEALTAELPQTPGSILAVLGTEDDKNYAVETLKKVAGPAAGSWKFTDEVQPDSQGLPLALYFFTRQPAPAKSD